MGIRKVRAFLAIIVVGVFMLITGTMAIYPLFGKTNVALNEYADFFSKTGQRVHRDNRRDRRLLFWPRGRTAGKRRAQAKRKLNRPMAPQRAFAIERIGNFSRPM